MGKDALRYAPDDDDDDDEGEEDVDMDRGSGWTREHTEMWLEYMKARGDVAVSKDTWQMVRMTATFAPLYSQDACSSQTSSDHLTGTLINMTTKVMVPCAFPLASLG